MTAEEETLLMIRGAVASMPEESRECINEMALLIRTMVLRAAPGEGAMAVALIGAELAANNGELS